MSNKINGRQGGTSLTVLEDLTAGASVRGITVSGVARVESVQWISEQAVKVIFRDYEGRHPCGGAVGKYSGPVAVHST